MDIFKNINKAKITAYAFSETTPQTDDAFLLVIKHLKLAIQDIKEMAARLLQGECSCPDDSGSCPYCIIYYADDDIFEEIISELM